MKPAPFTYHSPADASEALELLAEHAGQARPLAGGQSLVPLLNARALRVEHLVDLNRVPGLQGVRRDDGHVVVGAMTRHAALERDPVVGALVPLLARAMPLVGHMQIRSRGTLGGSLAHADPQAELPAVAAALDAELEIASTNKRRTVSAASFFLSPGRTVLREDELITAVRFPIWEGRLGVAVHEVGRRRHDYAVAGVACAVELEPGGRSVRRAAVALFGAAPTPVRAPNAEAALLAGEGPREAGEAAGGTADPVDDLYATARYRLQVLPRLVERALALALQEAEHAGP